MDKKVESGMFRINTRIGQKQNKWLDRESAETGISKSGLVAMALDQYIQQKDAVEAMNNMHDLYNKLADIENELKHVRENKQ
jgi:hypothetical protein